MLHAAKLGRNNVIENDIQLDRLLPLALAHNSANLLKCWRGKCRIIRHKSKIMWYQFLTVFSWIYNVSDAIYQRYCKLCRDPGLSLEWSALLVRKMAYNPVCLYYCLFLLLSVCIPVCVHYCLLVLLPVYIMMCLYSCLFLLLHVSINVSLHYCVFVLLPVCILAWWD